MANWITIDTKVSGRTKRCAFCKYFYDPTNTAIRPKNPSIGLWEFDSKAKSKCTIRPGEKIANFVCPQFVCKI